MLQKLSIHNYAIIQELDVHFSGQLNIITGETGAGKSIIIGALGLILGQRAEGNVLLNKEKKCIVEGTFVGLPADGPVGRFLREHELDEAEEVVVRREVAPSGKSRAFVNDTPVNITQLNALSSLLVDLHQQFDTLELGQEEFQRTVVDALAKNFDAVKAYGQVYSTMTAARRELEKLKTQKESFSKEFDYFQFQFNELEEAGFKEGELEDLDRELKLQSAAEGIKTALQKTYYELEESEAPIVRSLKALASGLQSYADLHADIPSLVERLQSAHIELQDLAGDADRISSQISADAAAIERINERMALGYKLLKKHGVQTTNELLAIRKDLEEKLQAVLNIDDEIAAAEKKHSALLQQAMTAAEKISAARQAQCAPLQKKVGSMLAQVGMPNAQLKVVVEKSDLGPYGADVVQFLFDANKKGNFQPLRKVASGGELSRLMLCIKSLVASSINLPTLIFDEIDTGISGEAAKQVGIILKDLAAARQVICITHQPQIAGKGQRHFFVYKEARGQQVHTGIRELSQDERIVAIAKMLSGEKPTAAAMENAREMVMN